MIFYTVFVIHKGNVLVLVFDYNWRAFGFAKETFFVSLSLHLDPLNP